MSEQLVTSRSLSKYRSLMKRINLHDADFAHIKKDINVIRQSLIVMDIACDVAGVFAEKTLLAMRLLTYGENTDNLDEEDVRTMMMPLDAMAGLTDGTFSALADEGVGFVKNVLPMCFHFIETQNLEIKDRASLLMTLRNALIVVTELKKDIIGRVLALGFCLYKYGMADVRDRMADMAERIILDRQDDAWKIYNKTLGIFKNKMSQDNNRFGVGMSIVLSECNVGSIDYNVVADIMSYMRKQATDRGHTYDFIKFYESSGFTILSQLVLKFYVKEDEEDGNKSIEFDYKVDDESD